MNRFFTLDPQKHLISFLSSDNSSCSKCRDENKFVQRIVGLPGDWILTNRAKRVLKVPEGYCWTEGDNSKLSRDMGLVILHITYSFPFLSIFTTYCVLKNPSSFNFYRFLSIWFAVVFHILFGLHREWVKFVKLIQEFLRRNFSCNVIVFQVPIPSSSSSTIFAYERGSFRFRFAIFFLSQKISLHLFSFSVFFFFFCQRTFYSIFVLRTLKNQITNLVKKILEIKKKREWA